MRSVSGAFGRPVLWSSCRCTVHLQGMRSVSGAFGRPVGVLQGMRSVSGAFGLQGMRSVSGAFGRPTRNEKCLRCFE